MKKNTTRRSIVTAVMGMALMGSLSACGPANSVHGVGHLDKNFVVTSTSTNAPVSDGGAPATEGDESGVMPATPIGKAVQWDQSVDGSYVSSEVVVTGYTCEKSSQLGQKLCVVTGTVKNTSKAPAHLMDIKHVITTKSGKTYEGTDTDFQDCLDTYQYKCAGSAWADAKNSDSVTPWIVAVSIPSSETPALFPLTSNGVDGHIADFKLS